MERVEAAAPDALTPGDSTPGLVRDVAFQTDRAIMVRARTEAGVMSGWHHHGDREAFGQVVRGRARFEFGPGEADRTEVPEGGFFHIPAGVVHRELNPSEIQQEMLVVFVGTGPLVANVDEPG